MEDRSAQRSESLTRRRLVESCIELLARGSRDWARRSLTADEVVAAAGVARRTFYLHFETMDELIDEARIALASPQLPAIGIVDGSDSIRHLIGEAARAEILSHLKAAVIISHMSGTEPLHRVSVTQWFEELLDGVATLGRVARSPLTRSLLAQQLSGMLEALALGGSSEAADTLLAVLAGATVQRLSDTAADDMIERFVEDVDRGAALRSAGEQFPELVRLVRDTALSYFDEVGFVEATLDEVARRSGLSLDAVARIFGSKTSLAVSIAAELGADLGLRHSPAAFDVNMISEALAPAVANHPSLADCLTLRPAAQALLAAWLGSQAHDKAMEEVWVEVMVPMGARGWRPEQISTP